MPGDRHRRTIPSNTAAHYQPIMLGQTPRPFSSIALVATLLISGVGITAPPTTARADDCLTAPNSPAPQGSHWYFHLDRATQRKCWYVRAPGQPAQQATAATTGPATPMHSTPAPSGASSPDVSAPPSPHVKISAAKPIPAPVRSGTTAKTVQQSAQDKNTASTPVVPAPQTSTSSETRPQAAAPPAVTWPDAAVAACCGQGAGTQLQSRPMPARIQCSTIHRGLPGAMTRPITAGFR